MTYYQKRKKIKESNERNLAGVVVIVLILLGVLMGIIQKYTVDNGYKTVNPIGITFRDSIEWKMSRKESLNKRERKEFEFMVSDEVKKMINHFDFNNHSLVMALIKQESQFNYKAISPTGAEGLMQFTEITLIDYKHDVYDYKKTIYNGVKYLSKLKKLYMYRDKYSDSDAEILAVASYNCGRGRILRDKYKITKNETINYVKIIFKNAKKINKFI